MGKLRNYRTKKDLPGRVDVGGYIVRFWKGGKYKKDRSTPWYRTGNRTLSHHRISLETYKPKPHPSLECDHRDEDRKNYAIRNLRWVSHPLNITFQTHKGYRTRRYPSGTMYQPCFRDKNYKPLRTIGAARDQYLYVRAVWIRKERERIIRMVMEHNSCTRPAAIDMLNWDERDDVDFLHEL